MTIVNEDQAAYWNGDESAHWVQQEARYDSMLEPFIEVILRGAALKPTDSVLDVGCGNGATTMAAARVVCEGDGRALGADLSLPMLGLARAKAEAAGLTNVTFEQADAQVHPFEDASFDVVISRFGVMFFADPTAAFANLRRATREGGRLSFVCWQAMAANEWFALPMMAMLPHVPPPEASPPPVDGAAGPFAFADADRLRGILGDAGWRDIAIEPRVLSVLMGGRGGMETAVEFIRTGRAGKTLLTGVDSATEAKALDALRAALASHLDDDGIRFDGAVWLATAHN